MLELEFLGGFRLALDGAPIERPLRPRLQTFLALLVLNAGRSFAREQLAGLLWPERSAEGSRGNLRRLLFDLRRDVPQAGALLVADGDVVQWPDSGPWRADVCEFLGLAEAAPTEEAVRAAVALYRGDLLPGSYDEWIVPERERLRALFLHLLDEGIALAESSGKLPLAIAYARRLVAEEPLREGVYHTLMRLYMTAGDSAGALRTYHLCAGTLERELGIAPGQATQALYASLAGAEPAPPATTTRDRLVDRGPEWHALQRAWAAASAGQSRLLLLTGEPGIGKSRLLAETQAWAVRRGIHALRARAYDTQTELALAPVVSLLRSAPLLDLAPVWLTEISRLLPELAATHPDLPPPQPLTEVWQRTRLFEALAQAVLGFGATLLLLDDLQWLDVESRDWLAFLLRYAPRARLLVVAATRPEGVATWGDGAAAREALRREGRLDEIELSPLDREHTRELASVHGADLDDTNSRRLWEETGGNPLFIIETLRAGSPEEARASISSVLRERFARLSPPARHVAGVAALIGRPFTVPLVAAAAHETDRHLVSALDELWRLRIIRDGPGDTYDFSHDRLRQGACDALSPATRRLLHGRIAGALAQVRADDPAGVSAEIAGHLDAAGEARAASPYYVQAGDEARSVFANDVAAAHYRRAVETLLPADRLPVYVRLGNVLTVSGSLCEAESVLRRAVAEADALNDARMAAESRLALGAVLQSESQYGEGDTWLEAARSTFEALGEPARLSATLSQLAATRAFQGDQEAARALLHDAERLAGEARDHGATMAALSRLFLTTFFASDFDAAEAHLLRHLALAEEQKDTRQQAVVLANLGLVHAERGEYRRALDEHVRAAETLDATGDSGYGAIALANLGLIYMKVGAFTRALRVLAVAADRGRRIALPLAEYASLVHIGNILAIRGRLDDANTVLPPAAGWLSAHSLPFQACEALYFLAELRRRRGDLKGAGEAAERARGTAEAIGRHDYALLAHLLLIRLDVIAGRVSVDAAVTQLEALAAEQHAPNRRALLHYTLWQLDPTRESDRVAAAGIYGRLHPDRPNVLYRERYHELTGEELPAPTNIPEPPRSVRDFPATDEELLQRLLGI